MYLNTDESSVTEGDLFRFNVTFFINVPEKNAVTLKTTLE